MPPIPQKKPTPLEALAAYLSTEDVQERVRRDPLAALGYSGSSRIQIDPGLRDREGALGLYVRTSASKHVPDTIYYAPINAEGESPLGNYTIPALGTILHEFRHRGLKKLAEQDPQKYGSLNGEEALVRALDWYYGVDPNDQGDASTYLRQKGYLKKDMEDDKDMPGFIDRNKNILYKFMGGAQSQVPEVYPVHYRTESVPVLPELVEAQGPVQPTFLQKILSYIK